MEDEKAVSEFERQVRHAGTYPFRATPEELAAMENDRKLVDQLFTRLIIESVQRWCEIAEQRLRGTGVRCFISPGNDDEPEIVDVLKTASYVEMPEGCVTMIDDEHEMVSSGFANTTPWHAPRDIPDEDLAAFIEGMAGQLRAPEKAVFNIHVPPYNTGLDTAPLLDDTLKPQIVAGEIATGPVGSKAVRAAIERYQPLVSVHGHIHESRAVNKLGRTTCLNPGSEYGDGNLRAALVNMKSANNHQVDIFLGTFEMCHKLTLEPRLTQHARTLSPADLLLTKLQIVQLNAKDIQDTLAILLDFVPQTAATQPGDELDVKWIARLCAQDWGWFTTVNDNLEKIAQQATLYLEADGAALITQRVTQIKETLEQEPKSAGWRVRALVGRKMLWYELPEEVKR